MPPHPSASVAINIPIPSDLVHCVDASGIPIRVAQPPPVALLSVTGDTSSMKTIEIALPAAIGGIALLLVVILVLIVILVKRTERIAHASDAQDAEKGDVQGDRDSVIDISAESSPVEERQDGGRPWAPALPSPRSSCRQSQPPPYRSRQGSAATTNGHSTPTSSPLGPSPLASAHTPPSSPGAPAPLTRRPSQTGIGVHFHLPFQQPPDAPPPALALPPLEMPAAASKERLADAGRDPRSPLDGSLLLLQLPPGLWPELEQDVAEGGEARRRVPPLAVAAHPSP